jgi:hypothetical protein
MKSDRIAFGFLSAIFFLTCIFNGCVEERNEAPKEIDFWRGGLSASGDLRLNREFNLEFSVNPLEDVSGVFLRFFLPEEIELVSGDTQWAGDLRKYELFEVSITVVVTDPGEWEVSVWIESQDYSSFDRAYFGHITSTDSSGMFSNTPGKSTDSKSETEEDENGGEKNARKF